MAAAVIKIPTTTTNKTSTHASAAAQSNESSTSESNNKENAIVEVVKIGLDENDSYCHLNSIKEEQNGKYSPISENLEIEKRLHNNVPLKNSVHHQLADNEYDCQRFPTTSAGLDESDFTKNNYDKHGIVERRLVGGGECERISENILDLSTSTEISPGLSLLQQTAAAASSPPPHSYRHSRAYRHFKNPPQPHMCIRTTTEAGEELFINVLSWTRIVIPQEPSDPIPLYGGMRVPPGSARSPPIVFAVMANPEVLKDSGRHSKDPEERRAMVELMCDFVEAMNPGVKLVRNAIILKDRDISGELKDVWNAVQAQRDREREEQLILQRQQHFHHNLPSSSTTTSNSLNMNSVSNSINNLSNTVTTQQMFPKSIHSGSVVNSNDIVVIPPSAVDERTPPRCRKLIAQQVQNEHHTTSNIEDIEYDNAKDQNNKDMIKSNNSQTQIILTEHLDNKLLFTTLSEQHSNDVLLHQQQQKCNQSTILNDDALINGNNSKESLVETSSVGTSNLKNQFNALNSSKDIKQQQKQQQQQQQQQCSTKNGIATNCNNVEVIKNENDTSITEYTFKLENNSNQTTCNTTNPPASPANMSSPTPVSQQAPTKKDKLGGFLPNGCIFPRFTKNNKHKDKDKDKDKDTKTKDKEKNVLLSALKKSKDKKTNVSSSTIANTVFTVSSDHNNTSLNTNTAVATSNCCNKITQKTSSNNQQQQQQQKNCLPQLECGIQKIDLNKHHHQNSLHVTENTLNKTNASNKNNISNNSSSVGVQ